MLSEELCYLFDKMSSPLLAECSFIVRSLTVTAEKLLTLWKHSLLGTSFPLSFDWLRHESSIASEQISEPGRKTSIHPFSTHASSWAQGHWGLLEMIPAVSGWRQGETQDKSPVHHGTTRRQDEEPGDRTLTHADRGGTRKFPTEKIPGLLPLRLTLFVKPCQLCCLELEFIQLP